MNDQIKEMFKLLPLKSKERLLKELEEITENEKKLPEKTPLEKAWEQIRLDVFALSCEPYIDDQMELQDVYEICDQLAKSGQLKDEEWQVRKAILLEMISNHFYGDYCLEEPMEQLMNAMFTTPEERVKAAELIKVYGDRYTRYYGEALYKKP